MGILTNLLFSPPPSILVNVMSVVNLVALANMGFQENKGKHLQYSKFWNVSSDHKTARNQRTIPSRIGMILAYTPAFLTAISSFVLFPDDSLRILLVKSALTIHFLKRLVEVLFIHVYSGRMDLQGAIAISSSYATNCGLIIYAQHLSKGLPEPHINLMYAGLLIFFVGIIGNFYHHYLLSLLRGKGKKGYQIPKGGLFDLVVCPHYLFEILGFVGVSMISQTLYSLVFTFGSACYLTGRSCATKKWYLSKFENFPKDKKVLIPFVL